jgi:hypothetical protein
MTSRSLRRIDADDRIRGGIEFGAFPTKFGANTCSFNSSP